MTRVKRRGWREHIGGRCDKLLLRRHCERSEAIQDSPHGGAYGDHSLDLDAVADIWHK